MNQWLEKEEQDFQVFDANEWGCIRPKEVMAMESQKEGMSMKLGFQVADVKKPLISVKLWTGDWG